ncbi:MAG TPA: sugar ABC transporter substrate-binding protein [Thermodesulfobacteriota bacterium]|nr:sugar ABC transporter substrate-binding protein [Thermodesulfobacteriota bacterium]
MTLENRKGRRETCFQKINRRQFLKSAVGVTGCLAVGESIFSGGVAPAFAKGKVNMTYWSRDYNQNDAKKYADEFVKLHPEYSIKVEGLPYAGMYEKLSTALMGGKAADLISCSLAWVAQFSEMGVLYSLDKQWERDIPKADRDDYFPGGISYCTYKGRLYGTPWRVDGNMLIWSVDAFKEAGIDPSKGPDTWEEVAEYGKKLTIREGENIKQYGLCMYGKPAFGFLNWYMAPLVWAYGGDFVDDKVTRSRCNEKPVIDAFKYSADLNNRLKIANPPAFSYGWSDISPILAKRATAILFGHQANFNIIWKVTPDMKLGAGPFPRGPAGRFSKADGWCHVIPKTANLEDIWPFCVYLQDPMRQAVLTVGAPGRKAGLAHPKYEIFKKDPLIRYAGGSGADTAVVRGLETHPLGPRIGEEIGRCAAEAWEGKLSPQEAALKGHEKVTTILKTG